MGSYIIQRKGRTQWTQSLSRHFFETISIAVVESYRRSLQSLDTSHGVCTDDTALFFFFVMVTLPFYNFFPMLTQPTLNIFNLFSTFRWKLGESQSETDLFKLRRLISKAWTIFPLPSKIAQTTPYEVKPESIYENVN